MNDLVERAREFAISAHQRIGHQRKYSQQPYQVHLEAVAKLVASVTDDPEMIAAAWLHDTVEDTPATLGDIENQFGTGVAELVETLTDISKASDGNRVLRKRLDLEHSAKGSARAKTVKLADLIDNCSDITDHDERFAQVYLVEMDALLQVLREGHSELLKEAERLHAKCSVKVGLSDLPQATQEPWKPEKVGFQKFNDKNFKRLFMDIFTAKDIAEGLLSFDANTSGEQAAADLSQHCSSVASVRIGGLVQGYVGAADITADSLVGCFRPFTVDQVVNSTASFTDVIHVLTRHDYCFVTLLGNVGGVISRDDINKPMVRMWLFGIVTMVEMGLVKMLHNIFPDDSWQQKMSSGRLQKALDIQAERQRRNRYCDLMDCLQLSDKAQVLISAPEGLARLGFESKGTAKRSIKELESLRNHLAHAQDIVQHDWPQIARLSMRIEEATRS
ncbi:MAG: HD domain-containing protein [Motiliproteus sp.]